MIVEDGCSSHRDGVQIGLIYFDDVASYPESVEFIEKVSELVWGCIGDGSREPYSMQETLDRLKEMVGDEEDEGPFYECEGWDTGCNCMECISYNRHLDQQEAYEESEED